MRIVSSDIWFSKSGQHLGWVIGRQGIPLNYKHLGSCFGLKITHELPQNYNSNMHVCDKHNKLIKWLLCTRLVSLSELFLSGVSNLASLFNFHQENISRHASMKMVNINASCLFL